MSGTSANTKSVYIDRDRNRAVLVAAQGYVLTNYQPTSMDIMWYEGKEIYDFPITTDGLGEAGTYYTITYAEHNAFLAQKQAEEQRIMNLFLGLSGNNSVSGI